MRERRSRPSWSVPSGKSRDGAWLSRPKFDLVYGSGARKSAKIATKQSTAITAPPATARRLRRSRRTPSRHRLDERTRGTPLGTATAAAASSVPDAGVEDAIEKVDNEVHDSQERSVREHHRHDHRIVAAGHREHEEASHAGHPKDRFDEKRAGSDRGEHRAHERAHW